MNKREHVINAVLLGIGVAYFLTHQLSVGVFEAMVMVTPPIVLGALFPDLDTAFGEHRKTFHNIWILGLALVFPYLFGNLYYVWVGILTHYTLDLLGNRYGMGVFHPLPGFYDIPVGVNVDSRWAGVVTVAVTAVELAVVVLIVEIGMGAQLSGPEVPVAMRELLHLL